MFSEHKNINKTDSQEFRIFGILFSKVLLSIDPAPPYRSEVMTGKQKVCYMPLVPCGSSAGGNRANYKTKFVITVAW